MTRDRSTSAPRARRQPTRASALRPPTPDVASTPTQRAAVDAGETIWPGDQPLELAAGYRLLAELFAAEPDEELLTLAATVPALAPHATDEAARRYTDVFVINAYPFASVYLEPDGAIDGERAGFTRGVLEALGLAVEPAIAADHVAVLLAALAALLEREAADANALHTDRARHAQRALLAEHLLPWAPHFLDVVERVDDGLYRAAAALTRRLLIGHAGLLFAGRVDARPAQTGGARRDRGRPAPPAPDPVRARVRTGPGTSSGPQPEAPLMRLTGPARCGFFLSRADIVGVASELGLAIRFGGRIFMLESVVQAAAQTDRGATLQAALVRFALERRGVLEDWSAALPALAPLWHDALGRLDVTVAGWQVAEAADPDAGAAGTWVPEP